MDITRRRICVLPSHALETVQQSNARKLRLNSATNATALIWMMLMDITTPEISDGGISYSEKEWTVAVRQTCQSHLPEPAKACSLNLPTSPQLRHPGVVLQISNPISAKSGMRRNVASLPDRHESNNSKERALTIQQEMKRCHTLT